MRKIIVSTMVSIDSVMENPQNWSFDYWNEEMQAYAREQLFSSDALISGRITYEAFAEAWSSRAGADEYADRINSLPKYVASRTLTEPLTWNSTLIKGDIAQEVTKLKQASGQNILQFGCGELTRTLLKHGLVDEFCLIVFPVAVGTGERLLEKVDQTPMKLLKSMAFATGIQILHYQPQSKA